MNKKNILIITVVMISVAGAAFYSGIKYGQSKTRAVARGQGNGFMMNFGERELGAMNSNSIGSTRGGMRFNGGFINGEIISKDDKSLTIKINDGGSKIVFYSDSTVVSKNTEGSIADLKVGDNVLANGTANQDGSMTAQNIQLRPQAPAPVPTPAQ